MRALGFPLIVKLPDGTFSQAVKKAENAAELDGHHPGDVQALAAA